MKLVDQFKASPKEPAADAAWRNAFVSKSCFTLSPLCIPRMASHRLSLPMSPDKCSSISHVLYTVSLRELTGPRPILKPRTKAIIDTELGIAQPLFMDMAKQKADIDMAPAETTRSCLGLYLFE